MVTQGPRSLSHCSNAQCLHFSGGRRQGPIPALGLAALSAERLLSLVGQLLGSLGPPLRDLPKLTLYRGASFISSLRATSEPATPSRMPWDRWKETHRGQWEIWLPRSQGQTGPPSSQSPGEEATWA